ncbi:MAG: MOSC domain-containing protein [Acidobacteriota bacterium]|nr:MOSC domain-containing protein [Acidobacteriota bacterium]
MKLLSVNVGLPRDVESHGRIVRTSIWKSPKQGRVRVNQTNLEGDAQSDLSVHDGIEKAVYVYPSEHYAFWRDELPDTEIAWGGFGENLTIEGLLESEVRIGDRLSIGSAQFEVTQPRLPCYKLGIRFGRDDIIKRFLRSGRSGFYLAVVQGGDIGAGDSIERTSQNRGKPTIAEVAAHYLR